MYKGTIMKIIKTNLDHDQLIKLGILSSNIGLLDLVHPSQHDETAIRTIEKECSSNYVYYGDYFYAKSDTEIVL